MGVWASCDIITEYKQTRPTIGMLFKHQTSSERLMVNAGLYGIADGLDLQDICVPWIRLKSGSWVCELG